MNAQTLTQIVQKFLSSVLCRLEDEQILIPVNKLCVHCAIQELAITQYILQKGYISLKERERKKKRAKKKTLDNQWRVKA